MNIPGERKYVICLVKGLMLSSFNAEGRRGERGEPGLAIDVE